MPPLPLIVLVSWERMAIMLLIKEGQFSSLYKAPTAHGKTGVNSTLNTLSHTYMQQKHWLITYRFIRSNPSETTCFENIMVWKWIWGVLFKKIKCLCLQYFTEQIFKIEYILKPLLWKLTISYIFILNIIAKIRWVLYTVCSIHNI